MLVAPTPAEYRLLGTNEPLLAALRAATAGRELAAAEDVWRHDLGTTTAASDLLPWLLLIALVLWPLDVAVRRVSVARSDLALARAWTGARWRTWRGPARRPERVDEMLAAARRAGGAESRAALVSKAPELPLAVKPASRNSAPTVAAAPEMPPESADTKPGPAEPPADTLARLREAKQRARDSR
jgi:hypothetical protein